MTRLEQPGRLVIVVLVGLASWALGLIVAEALLIALTDTPMGFDRTADSVSFEVFFVLVLRALLALAIAAVLAVPLARAVLRGRR